MLMASLDGIENKIDPGDPMDKDLDLPRKSCKGPNGLRFASPSNGIP